MEGSIDLSCAESSFPNAGLLKLENTSRYCGQAFSPIAPATLDPSKLRRPETMADVERQLGVLTAMVDTLWERARSGGTSSRVAIQMQIIELITHAFSTVFPVPRPSSATANNGSAASSSSTSASILNVGVASGLTPAEEQASSLVYSQPLPDVPTASAAGGQQQAQPDPQVTMCKMIHKLFLSYGTAWQSVETPSRGFDSERGLIAMTMLSIYDAIARNSQNSKQGWLLAHLLSDDGGYFLSTTVCKGNRPFADIASMMELTQPQLLPVLACVIRYNQHQQTTFRRELFDLRMPDKLEVRKHSNTVDFLRKFLEHCGYDVFSRSEGGSMAMMMAQSEMEKLMTWMCDARSPLARDHPEFTMLRDVVLLAKFLTTMEVRDAQLLRKKKQLDEFATWRISFDEDAPGRQMSAGWRTRPSAPMWECVMVRGRDMDIADIAVKGFGDRELLY